ncbi:MAG TPA: DUF4157 domain-containing protein [Chloroflexia bacterium]|nr:DUF4157 domain-containing protein [Chloroflexia bacterium]
MAKADKNRQPGKQAGPRNDIFKQTNPDSGRPDFSGKVGLSSVLLRFASRHNHYNHLSPFLRQHLQAFNRSLPVYQILRRYSFSNEARESNPLTWRLKPRPQPPEKNRGRKQALFESNYYDSDSGSASQFPGEESYEPLYNQVEPEWEAEYEELDYSLAPASTELERAPENFESLPNRIYFVPPALRGITSYSEREADQAQDVQNRPPSPQSTRTGDSANNEGLPGQAIEREIQPTRKLNSNPPAMFNALARFSAPLAPEKAGQLNPSVSNPVIGEGLQETAFSPASPSHQSLFGLLTNLPDEQANRPGSYPALERSFSQNRQTPPVNQPEQKPQSSINRSREEVVAFEPAGYEAPVTSAEALATFTPPALRNPAGTNLPVLESFSYAPLTSASEAHLFAEQASPVENQTGPVERVLRQKEAGPATAAPVEGQPASSEGRKDDAGSSIGSRQYEEIIPAEIQPALAQPYSNLPGFKEIEAFAPVDFSGSDSPAKAAGQSSPDNIQRSFYVPAETGRAEVFSTVSTFTGFTGNLATQGSLSNPASFTALGRALQRSLAPGFAQSESQHEAGYEAQTYSPVWRQLATRQSPKANQTDIFPGATAKSLPENQIEAATVANRAEQINYRQLQPESSVEQQALPNPIANFRAAFNEADLASGQAERTLDSSAGNFATILDGSLAFSLPQAANPVIAPALSQSQQVLARYFLPESSVEVSESIQPLPGISSIGSSYVNLNSTDGYARAISGNSQEFNLERGLHVFATKQPSRQPATQNNEVNRTFNAKASAETLTPASATAITNGPILQNQANTFASVDFEQAAPLTPGILPQTSTSDLNRYAGENALQRAINTAIEQYRFEALTAETQTAPDTIYRRLAQPQNRLKQNQAASLEQVQAEQAQLERESLLPSGGNQTDSLEPSEQLKAPPMIAPLQRAVARMATTENTAGQLASASLIEGTEPAALQYVLPPLVRNKAGKQPPVPVELARAARQTEEETFVPGLPLPPTVARSVMEPLEETYPVLPRTLLRSQDNPAQTTQSGNLTEATSFERTASAAYNQAASLSPAEFSAARFTALDWATELPSFQHNIPTITHRSKPESRSVVGQEVIPAPAHKPELVDRLPGKINPVQAQADRTEKTLLRTQQAEETLAGEEAAFSPAEPNSVRNLENNRVAELEGMAADVVAGDTKPADSWTNNLPRTVQRLATRPATVPQTSASKTTGTNSSSTIAGTSTNSPTSNNASDFEIENRFAAPLEPSIGVIGAVQPMLELPVQRKANHAESAHAPETNRPSLTFALDMILRTAVGNPLESSVKSKMGNVFARNFENVRVHTDERSAEYASKMGAEAFTVGSNIFFAPGRYQPHQTEGQALIGHELTHVIQQASLPSLGGGRIPETSSEGQALEHEAIHNERLLMRHLENTQPENQLKPAIETGIARLSDESLQRQTGGVVERSHEPLNSVHLQPAPPTRSEPASFGTTVQRVIDSPSGGDLPAPPQPFVQDEGNPNQQPDIQAIAREVYKLLKQQLLIERERGGYRGGSFF